MHLSDEETDLLKAWVIKRLEDNSEADPEVLADYVLALLKTDESDAQVRQNCIENLEDFLKEHTASFVDSILEAIRSKSYDPKAAQTLQATAPSFQPSGPLGAPPSEQLSRKRSFQDEDIVMGDGSQSGRRGGFRGGDRPQKQMRRGGREQNQRGGRGGSFAQTQQPQMPNFDPNNPMAAFLAMQQAMGLQFPGMPQMQFPGGMQQPHQAKRPGQRCRDYDNKGFCVRGAACPYEHGTDTLVVPGGGEEYDPANAMMSNEGQGQRQFSDRGRGRGRGRGDRGTHRGGRGGRAEFSSAGPNHDRSITSVVVENIPEDKYNEDSVREFFSEFGTIDEVTLQDYKRLAIIKYPDYDSAKSAYDSPKVIFDNRFVKVYWYRPESLPKPRAYQNSHKASGDDTEMRSQPPEEQIDPAELARKQEEAQRQHEERMAQAETARLQRAELEEKMRLQAEERSKLLAKLAAKEKSKNGTGTPEVDVAMGTESDATGGPTAALKAKLAALEAEARSIGLNPNDSSDGSGYGRGRGGFRGRGTYVPRGYRGGRGGYAAPRGGSVMRLDNRPKAIAIAFPNGEDFTEAKDEALKQYLLFSDLMESATIAPHPERKDAAVVAFKERYKAEQFLASAGKEVPHIGKCELSWVPNAAVPVTVVAQVAGNGEGDVGMEDRGRRYEDFDVDDEDDGRWMAD